jgi:hypothetical protein
MINIACVLRQGGKVGYDATWVEKLKNSVSRNLSLPYKFVCLSDCDVPCERIPLISFGKGFWSKLELFRPNLFNGPVLYIDLDNVICGNLDELVEKIIQQQEAAGLGLKEQAKIESHKEFILSQEQVN